MDQRKNYQESDLTFPLIRFSFTPFILSPNKWLRRGHVMQCNIAIYYSIMMSFYHIWSRERAKYETVIYCSVPV